MTAELLREAARVLRERAEAGPTRNDHPWRAVREPARSGNGRVTSVITSADESVFEDAHCLLADAEWIATVHPGVGLALANLLDRVAADFDCNDDPAVVLTRDCVEADALRAARTILGEAGR